VFGMIERGGQVIIRMLENVRQKTIKPLIKASIAPGTLVYTDEYDIYARLEKWGYRHQSVCHGGGEYMRVTTMATDSMKRLSTRSKGCGLCYALAWLRPHRGVSQDKLPLYLGFFEFIHNAKKRGKALLASLVGVLAT
jgi:transposase